MHEAPNRLKHVFEFKGIQPEDTPYRVPPEHREGSKHVEMPCRGVIYFIKSGKHIKIGITTQEDVQKRMDELQCGNPTTLRLLHTIQCEDYTTQERTLHDAYADYHKRGEWFAIPKDEQERIKGCMSVGEVVDGLPLTLSQFRSDIPPAT